MCQKTNQFNLRSKRYSASELIKQNNHPDKDLFMVKLVDKFGDHGLVAVIGLDYMLEKVVFIDTFLMSCRVLGRHLEAWILNEILILVKAKKSQYLLVDFIDTSKNKIAKDFLISYGFKIMKDNNNSLSLMRKINNKYIKGNLYGLLIDNKKVPNLEIYEGDGHEFT